MWFDHMCLWIDVAFGRVMPLTAANASFQSTSSFNHWEMVGVAPTWCTNSPYIVTQCF